jgi:hypothetical protein
LLATEVNGIYLQFEGSAASLCMETGVTMAWAHAAGICETDMTAVYLSERGSAKAPTIFLNISVEKQKSGPLDLLLFVSLYHSRPLQA